MTLEEEKEEEIPCGSSPPKSKDPHVLYTIDLLDEFWFFRNSLSGVAKILRRRELPPPPSPFAASLKKAMMPVIAGEKPLEEDGVVFTPKPAGDDPIATRSLRRTPSLPAHTRREENHQLPSPSKMTRSMSMRRYKSRRYCNNNQHYNTITGGKSFREAFQFQWKSLSDLECEEVQGFKDLGFVFDNKEAMSTNIVKVIPGLREKRIDEDKADEVIRRPYLSEAWQLQRPAAPPAIRWADGSSPKDVKEQLRFWARAVACNVLQEC